ncbi:homocysteine S-methyltransferase family protein [Rouxiella badensis]|jgi:S-methylmethionine-dependent homocysteine/selenocysteine methylase|uniref:Homocysteine S-methyltransferase n=1 Tax=Rouxiella badensis TaxID=1646377 RepID=A0A1X0WIY0_9GAMM|nr:homocysteine S-methyltransferase family protein [Rouxiella badensis]MCC3703668.1 homocysteine S-methyltransferase family protein [Rouxiella badensis]MCC3720470.1 homocysteine S-methyltransferase family protein [Rouxiella badensis]MCC3730309.1 homocysteine S-methyltransferase family protein [Rouxiella badensis]MCC3734515.1 homocysteine S-methyltransferase family protein [Rouxiella badensis]MCC3742249.1 homocysteine S-methyltransferase family protein [Rouxiella badensis]
MTSNIVILDGGMGRELARMGAPFRQPEWSALALMEAPHFVRQAHDAFIAAGSQVITTNSYAVVPFHVGDDVFSQRGAELIALSGKLAREAADAAPRPVKVAGSLPPVLGSYRPDLFEPVKARALLSVLVAGLNENVDLWLAETQSSVAEVELVREVLGDDKRPLWLSFTLQDALNPQEQAVLRSGESVAAAVDAALRLNAQAVLFNCSRPEVMASAVAEASKILKQQGVSLDIGVYANAFEPSDNKRGANEGLSEMRKDTDPQGYLSFAEEWVAAGATMIGGCCGIGPEHIAALNQALASTSKS